MVDSYAKISISVPTSHADGFPIHWKELRLADALPPEFDLTDSVEVENFDGATLVQWVVQVTPVIAPIIIAAFGYLVAARGELEYEGKDQKIRIKNIKPSKLKELLEIIESNTESK